MAKNWKVGEAVRAIQSGSTEDKLDIGRRFPLFAILSAQVNEAGAAIMDCMPDYITARKVESVLKGEIQDSDSGDEAPDEEEKTVKEEKAGKASKSNEETLESKSPKELYEIAVKLGIEVEKKKPADVYIKAIKKHQAAEAKKAAAAAKEKEKAKSEEEDWGEEEEEKSKGKGKAKSDDDDWDI